MPLYLSPCLLEHTAETCYPVGFFKRILGGREKRETRTIDLQDLDEWLKDKTKALDERAVPIGKQVHAEILDLQTKVKKLSEELLQHHVPDDVLSAFRAPAENARRHFARGVATIVGNMELKKPTSYIDVVSLQSTTNDALNSVHKLRMHQGRYVAEFFPGVYREILHQVNRLRLLAKQLERILADQKEMFDLLQQVSSNKNLVHEKLQLLAASKSREADIEADVERMTRSAAELRERTNELSRAREYLAAANQQEQIAQYRENISHLEQDIYRQLSLLSRTFRKHIKHTERSDHQINTHSRRVLEGYLREPTQTFLNEADGYPGLKALLIEIRKEVINEKLQLRERSREKTLSNIDKILADGLMPLKRKHQELKQKIRQIEGEVSSSIVLKNLNAAKRDLSDTEHLIKKLREEKEHASQATRSLREDIGRLLHNLEEQLSGLDGAKIKLEVKEIADTRDRSVDATSPTEDK